MTQHDETNINTGGGTYISGSIDTGGGDFVGRDKIINYFTRDYTSLQDLYIPPDAVYQRVNLNEFVGRTWLIAKVDAFLNNSQRKAGVLVLEGEAGVGKTALMAHLVHERNYLHLFAEQVPGDVNLLRALQSLGAQLVVRYGITECKERDTLPQIAQFPDFLEKLLRLAASRLPSGEKLVVVCDALDEAGTAPNGNVFGLPAIVPDGVFFILTQRPVPIRLNFKNVTPQIVRLDAASIENLEDVETYLRAVTHQPQIAAQLHAQGYSEYDFVHILRDKSGGIWMYLQYVIQEISECLRAPLDLDLLPPGLAGYYAEYWGDWRSGRNGRGMGTTYWDALYAPLLVTLAAAQEPITLECLMVWAGVQADPYEVQRLVREMWHAFMTNTRHSFGGATQPETYSIYHASLRDFITGKVDQSYLLPTHRGLVSEFRDRTEEAHTRIIADLHERCAGDWLHLINDDYARRYLVTHLASAGEYVTLFHLVAEDNAWAEAHYTKEESYAGYLLDLAQAWAWAETDHAWSVERQIRCGLIQSSIYALAGNIEPELPVQLVETGFWSAVTALANIKQIGNVYRYAEALTCVVRVLPSALHTELLQAAQAIRHEETGVKTLTVLAEFLSMELQGQILQMTQTIESPYYKKEALIGLAAKLPVKLLPEVLRIARTIKDTGARAGALSGLVAYLPENLKLEVVNESLLTVREVKEPYLQAKILNQLAMHIPPMLQAEALKITYEIKNGQAIAWILTNLAEYLSENLLTKALWMAKSIEYDRAEVLCGLIAHLPIEARADIACDALDATQVLIDDEWVAPILSELLTHLPAELATETARRILHTVQIYQNENKFSDWNSPDTERMLAGSLSKLSPYLPLDLQREALQAVWAFKDSHARAKALSGLSAHIPVDLQRIALQKVLGEWYEDYKAEAFTALVIHLPAEIKMEALQKVRMISRASRRVEALNGLTAHLPSEVRVEVMRETLKVLRTIENASEWPDLEIWHDIVKQLPIELHNDALQVARSIKQDLVRAKALCKLATYLSGKLKVNAVHEAFQATRTIRDRKEYIFALNGLSPHLPAELGAKAASEAFYIALEVSDASQRNELLTMVVPNLSTELKVEGSKAALQAARMIRYARDRVEALIELEVYLPEELKAEAMHDALGAALSIDDDPDHIDQYVNKLIKLAAYLPAELQVKAWRAAQKIWHKDWRSSALIGLVAYLPAELQTEALHEVRSISDIYTRALGLSRLAAHLSPDVKTEVAHEALQTARALEKNHARAFALIELLPLLAIESKTKVIREVLQTVKAIETPETRLEALCELIVYLSDDVRTEAINEARATLQTIDENQALTFVANEVATKLPVEIQAHLLPRVFTAIVDNHVETRLLAKTISAWRAINFLGLDHERFLVRKDLRLRASWPRPAFLGDLAALAPLIAHLGGEKAVEETFRAIHDVTRWWP